MARTAVKPKDQQPTEEPVPSWQRDSVDRSLRNARARAQQRSDRFVAAAVELLEERDESDFTIQDVVDRSTMSQRTFYTFFDSKDSLLLAVYETILRKTAMPILRERCEGIADPVLRLRALLEAISEITAMPARLSRGLSVLHLRLTESRPNDLAYALEPLHALLVELLTGVADAGLLREVVVEPGRSYFDTNTADHHHFFCEATSKLQDIPGRDVVVSGYPLPPQGTEICRVDVVIRVRPENS